MSLSRVHFEISKPEATEHFFSVVCRAQAISSGSLKKCAKCKINILKTNVLYEDLTYIVTTRNKN